MAKLSKKDEKFLGFAKNPSLAVHDELVENNDLLKEANNIFGTLDVNKLKNIKGEKGEKGDTGAKGERGAIGPQGLRGESSKVPGPRGFQGEKGYDGVDGQDGKDGMPGKDGIDGSPDDGKEIVRKINDTPTNKPEYKIDAIHIKNLPSIVQEIGTSTWGSGGTSEVFHDTTLSGNGTQQKPLKVIGGGGGTYTGTSPIHVTGTVISIDKADVTHDGYLSSTDYNTFNSKANSQTYTANQLTFGNGTTTLQQTSNATLNSSGQAYFAGGLVDSSGKKSVDIQNRQLTQKTNEAGYPAKKAADWSGDGSSLPFGLNTYTANGIVTAQMGTRQLYDQNGQFTVSWNAENPGPVTFFSDGHLLVSKASGENSNLDGSTGLTVTTSYGTYASYTSYGLYTNNGSTSTSYQDSGLSLAGSITANTHGELVSRGDTNYSSGFLNVSPNSGLIQLGDYALGGNGNSITINDLSNSITINGIQLTNNVVVYTTGYYVGYMSGYSLNLDHNFTYISGSTNFSGDINQINGVSYSWTTSQGAANTYLNNDGSGNLTWSAISSYTTANARSDTGWTDNGTQIFQTNSGRNVGIGITTPTALLHVGAGSASLSQMKLTSGTILTTPVADTVENSGTHIYWTSSAGTRYQLDQQTGGGGSGTVTSVSGTTNRISVATGTTTPVIDIAATYVGQTSITTLGTISGGTWQGTAIADAYISSASTWNAKQNAITLTTTGTSGAATFSGGTLNIPNYASGINPSSTTVTASGTLSSTTQTTIRVNSSSATTQTLPTSPAIGTLLRVKNVGTGVVTVAGTIDGGTNDILYSQYELGVYQYNGTNWDKLN